MRNHKETLKSGFTLVEILAATALMALLLTAIAAAMQASFKSYSENDRMSSVTQAARSILMKMTREIRVSEDISSNSTSVTIIPIADSSGVTQIKYELSAGTLTYYRTVGTTTESSVILGDGDKVHVTGLSLSPVMGVDAMSQPCTKALTIKITLSVDNQTFALTATAAPRRNQLF